MVSASTEMGAISQFGNNAVITPGRPHALAFRSNVEIVVLPCAVVDANGAPVGALTRDDFHVYDNDTRRPIENFWIDDDLPLTLGVLIDASESQKEQLSEHKQTAIELLERILRPSDRAFVISVDENARLWADLSETSSDVQTQLAGTPGCSESLAQRNGAACLV
jgi:Ca-activated chloride channel family protein